MATLTLEKMAAGGIYDQLGGGFHRYSTDARWLVPHFEKMLYDNALLAVAYAEALPGDRARRLRARRARDARLPAARDDRARRRLLFGDRRRLERPTAARRARSSSGPRRRSAQCWAPARRPSASSATTASPPAGNFEGANILAVAAPDETRARRAGAAARARSTRRAPRRSPPLRDEKILAAWNGLAISALAVGGPRARRAALRRAPPRARRRSCSTRCARAAGSRAAPRTAAPAPPASSTTTRSSCAGLIDLYEATFEPRWLREAIALADETERAVRRSGAAAGS